MANNRILGENSIFFIKYNNIWCPISCETSSPISENVEMIDTTTRDNGGWKTEKPTLQSYSISVEAALRLDDEMDVSGVVSYNKLRLMKRNRELVEWKRETFGGWYIDQGKAYITDIGDSNAVGEEIMFSMSLSGFGAPEITTNPNLLLNSDFTTDIDGWNLNSPDGAVSWSSENGGSLYVDNGAGSGGVFHAVSLDAGVYSVGFFAKPFFQSGSTVIRVYLADTYSDVIIHTDAVWKYYSMVITTDGDPDYIVIQPLGGDQKILFDKIKLERGATPTPWIPNIND